MGKFLAMYPELRLHLQLLNGDESAREGELDVVIRAGVLEDSGCWFNLSCGFGSAHMPAPITSSIAKCLGPRPIF